MLTLQGLGRLTHFDATGFLFFDASPRGFWRSFAAAGFCLPMWVLGEYIHVGTLDSPAALHSALIALIAYVFSWLIYPMIVLKVSTMFGVWPHYYRYMVGYNWFQTVLQFVQLPFLLMLLMPEGSFSSDMFGCVVLLLQAVEFAYSWFMARWGLGLAAPTAAALAIIDFLLGLLIDQIAAVI